MTFSARCENCTENSWRTSHYSWHSKQSFDFIKMENFFSVSYFQTQNKHASYRLAHQQIALLKDYTHRKTRVSLSLQGCVCVNKISGTVQKNTHCRVWKLLRNELSLLMKCSIVLYYTSEQLSCKSLIRNWFYWWVRLGKEKSWSGHLQQQYILTELQWG